MVYEANWQVKETVLLLEQVVSRFGSRDRKRIILLGWRRCIIWLQYIGILATAMLGLEMMKHIVEIQRQVLDEHHPARIGSEAWLEQFEREIANTKIA
jgi:hypothetical protein